MKIPALFTNPMYLIDMNGRVPDNAQFFKVPAELVPYIHNVLCGEQAIDYQNSVSMSNTCIIYDDNHIALQLTECFKGAFMVGWAFNAPGGSPYLHPPGGAQVNAPYPGSDYRQRIQTIHQRRIDYTDEVYTYVVEKTIMGDERSRDFNHQPTFPQIVNTITRLMGDTVLISRQGDTSMPAMLMASNYRMDVVDKLLTASCVEVKPDDDDFGWIVKPESIIYVKPVTE